MQKNIFKHLMLLGRPAAGKSEFIDFMKKISDAEREEKFHIGKFVEVDDFPWIWEKIAEDDVWEKATGKRLYSRCYMPGNPSVAPEGAPLYDFCMEKFNRVIKKDFLGKPEFYNEHTLIIEFSRREFEKALNKLQPEILENSAILHIYVTKDESWRRNVARYQEKLKHSILAHMLPKETFDHFYSENDWNALTHNEPCGCLTVHGVKVPFVTMNNEPESVDPVVLDRRYGESLRKLMELKRKA